MGNTVSTSKKQRITLALGFFDCVHLGHRKILKVCAETAKETDSACAVFTFLDDVKKFGKSQIYTYQERKTLFGKCGVERIVAYPFNDEIKNTTASDFLDGLRDKYEIAAFVCGEDYTFGAGRQGNIEFLSSYAKNNGILLRVVPDVTYVDKRISSTTVKELLSSGEIIKANYLLGEPYFVLGKVVTGRGEGHLHGIPTANIKTENDKFLPKKGVYACSLTVDGKEYHAVTNVGEKPTFDDYTTTIEAFIGDFDGDIYGKKVTLRFYEYLRDTEKFATPKLLSEKVKNDLAKWEEKC